MFNRSSKERFRPELPGASALLAEEADESVLCQTAPAVLNSHRGSVNDPESESEPSSGAAYLANALLFGSTFRYSVAMLMPSMLAAFSRDP
jgi:hypothetical protein